MRVYRPNALPGVRGHEASCRPLPPSSVVPRNAPRGGLHHSLRLEDGEVQARKVRPLGVAAEGPEPAPGPPVLRPLSRVWPPPGRPKTPDRGRHPPGEVWGQAAPGAPRTPPRSRPTRPGRRSVAYGCPRPEGRPATGAGGQEGARAGATRRPHPADGVPPPPSPQQQSPSLPSRPRCASGVWPRFTVWGTPNPRQAALCKGPSVSPKCPTCGPHV